MRLRLLPALATLLLPAGQALADMPGVANPARAESNYRLHCQGCHGPEASGSRNGEVPAMRGFIGHFLKVDGGRAFLVRVPGSANAGLTDAALAELLNWLLASMSAEQTPADFVPYRAEEVASWRQAPLQDPAAERLTLIRRLAGSG